MSNQKLRIFLADDHAVVREGLKALIERETDMEIVGEANDGHCVIDKMAGCETEIVVLDISMPGPNGVQVAEWISKNCPKIKVIAMTVHEDAAYLRWIMRWGARGYVLKRSAPDELIKALRAVATGEVYVDPAMAHKLTESTSGAAPTGTTAVRRPLSDRETEVARLVAEGHSNKEIASSLDISVKTVETHKSRVMEKLQINSRAELVGFAISHGWLGSA